MNKLASTVMAVAVLGFASTAGADVRLTILRGHVTLVAKDATVRQILAEWARVGQTKILNAERIPGGPLTLELTDVPEQQALDILLRAVSGYLAAPRVIAVANASVFDRIVVMPTSVAPTAPPSSASSSFGQPASAPPRPVFEDQGDERAFPPVGGPNRPPVFMVPPPAGGPQIPAAMGPGPVFPPPSATAPPPPNAAYPGAPTVATPTGSSVPGMVVPAPAAQPGAGQPVTVFPGQPQ